MKRHQIRLEYIFRASPAILDQFLTTPDCLVRWFCDKVDINGNVFTFHWVDNTDEATLLDEVDSDSLRFFWENLHEEDEYLEFRITESPVTGETIMTITDFCDPSEARDQERYWNTQMDQLRLACGG
jgi:uncharacterized protein YndB with AHSA1/START domain